MGRGCGRAYGGERPAGQGAEVLAGAGVRVGVRARVGVGVDPLVVGDLPDEYAQFRGHAGGRGRAPGFSVPHPLTSLVCFLVGTSAVVAFTVPDATTTTYALIALTAFAMGLRNATVLAMLAGATLGAWLVVHHDLAAPLLIAALAAGVLAAVASGRE
ncbi:hypothetical protein [Streptomyces sp. NPDC059631]|uniref:hypothetical protein n=1 Tax=unclassified Streptomyces TaxID=2593676 RepID=UPI0036AFDC80